MSKARSPGPEPSLSSLADLLLRRERIPLFPGDRHDAGITERIESLATEERGPEEKAVLAGLHLLNDDLQRSHALAQELASKEGRYWHALVHRRERDFSNSKYWFRRIGKHSIFGPLAERVATLEAPPPGRAGRSDWDPFAFVDACAAGSSAHWLEQAQKIEMELLIQHCLSQLP